MVHLLTTNASLQVLLSLFMGFSLVACTQDEKAEIIDKPDLTVVPIIEQERDSIHNFLAHPFDLHQFKQRKNGALSGGFTLEKYHHKPSEAGVVYRFFMFEPKTANYTLQDKEIRNPKLGYIGSSKNNISIEENGLVICTFQPSDNNEGQYLHPHETLIEVFAQYNDFDLPELAFVGLDTHKIQNQLGAPDTILNNSWVYQYENKVLLLKLKQQKVDWLKYVVLKTQTDISQHPALFTR